MATEAQFRRRAVRKCYSDGSFQQAGRPDAPTSELKVAMRSQAIWYINHYSGGPGIGPAFRPFNLVRAWRAAGHDAAVITARFHHLLDENRSLPETMDVEGVPYFTVRVRQYSGNGLGRLLNMLDFTLNLRKLTRALPDGLPKPDVIIASSPHLFAFSSAALLARTYGARLVFEIRDLWPLSLIELAGLSRFHPFALACAVAERDALRRADVIASVLPRADRYLAEKGYGEKPFVWVPNGIAVRAPLTVAPECPTTQHAREILKAWKREGRVVFIHAGSMGPPNGLLELLDALDTQGARAYRDRFAVLLVGGGVLREEITRRAAHCPCRIEVVGRIAKSNVATLIENSDIGYCGLAPRDNLYRFGVSLNKFADYMGGGLPCVLPVDPCGDPVSESGAGIAATAPDADALWSILARLIDLTDEERKSMGRKGRAYMQDKYDTTRIAERYLEAIVSTAGAGA